LFSTVIYRNSGALNFFMATKYVSEETTPLLKEPGTKKRLTELLWGDRVTIDAGTVAAGGFIKVKARGKTGFVKEDHIGNESLLELYFIDVGQGDGVLIRTPDHKHILIDGGYLRKYQPSGKNGADFVDWKFFKDYGTKTITIDAMVCSHNDADHYGGLWDIINPDETENLDCTKVVVGAFYHAGVGWFKNASGARSLGKKENGFLHTLFDTNASIKKLLKTNPTGYQFQGEWRGFMENVAEFIPECKRLSNKTGYLHGFEENKKVSVKVLGPVEFKEGSKPVLKSLGNDSKNTNGNSALLMLQYGGCKILLTGDLNANSQKLLLEAAVDNPKEFECDIAKACHHGSHDVSYAFLEAMHAGATIISSGDEEGHDHPRPVIVAASALSGFKEVNGDVLVTPLVYSTEMARSYRLGKTYELKVRSGAEEKKLTPADKIQAYYQETASGDLNPRKRDKEFWSTYLVSGIVYGLVNVRTDGKKILCATLNEKDATWSVKTFNARF